MTDEELTRDEIEARLAALDDRQARFKDARETLTELREAASDLAAVEDDILDERAAGALDAIDAICWRLAEDLGQVDTGIYWERRRLREQRRELDCQEADR